ncbi:hypothetical protein Sliba_07270 [Streptomyces nigrescens]|uniref:Uncharacterized protein n=1 Tax=Streptomyces nigrescens TaxID=1920 RepID=A0A640TAS0_STRNI|nr:hypothetical protein Sliba_07270 [Streptomyces libani subsp. libani]GGV86440.1 hypothetical protein GCM10010500_04710 [Streptomyces libani subsp. libani]
MPVAHRGSETAAPAAPYGRVHSLGGVGTGAAELRTNGRTSQGNPTIPAKDSGP